ncbi:MAG: amidase [Myxococcota bacterium]
MSQRNLAPAPEALPLVQRSAQTLAAQIRRGQLSSSEVVDAHIARIQAVNPTINAVVAERFSAARAEAAAADQTLRQHGPDAVGPLHGVPCTIKENFRLIGMPNSSGVVARRGVIAGADAPAVARLRAAGAIPLGVTNTSEVCMWMESYNRLYGRTRNPYNPEHIVGGSSGGEGAIVGAGGTPFGLGSDIGGSIRMPAFFNGVFGHKGSSGLVPNTGQHPIADTAMASGFLSTGPLCRRAEDLYPILQILAGPDGQDPAMRDLPLDDPEAVDLAGVTVLVVREDGRHPVDPAMQQAQQRAAAALAARGARIEARRFDRLAQSAEIWMANMGEANDADFRSQLFEGRPAAKLRREWPRWLLRRGSHTLPALLLATIERLMPWIPLDPKDMVLLGEALRAEVQAALGPRTLMLYPPYPVPAPRHREPLMRPFAWSYCGIVNMLRLPATQVPLGLDEERGLPLGVQVIGADGQDHLTIAAALALEEDLGGWVWPG